MRKVLLSVMTVGFLLAFNACKKGDQGPIGPSGPTGAAGAAGTVGPAGVAGADGSKILTGTTAPAAATGANGDFYFDSTSKTLYGPKAAGAWPAGTSLAGSAGAAGATGATGATGAPGTPGTNGTNGANGVTGATGVKGTQFLYGPGAPTAGTGNEGDFYFDTTNSVFYGPKAGTVWAANLIPLGTANAAKTFYLTVGVSNVQQVNRTNGQANTFVWGPVEISSSYFLDAEDVNRISKYAGWGLNREMIFQTNPTTAPGVFDAVPQIAADLGASTDELTGGANPNTTGFAHFRKGAKFRYTQNFGNPTQEFTLTQNDIDRLKENGGNSFTYLTYAAVDQSVNLSTKAVGFRLEFHRTKRVNITDLTTAAADLSGAFHATYSAETSLNLNTVAGLGTLLERYKQDGKVFLKYRYVDPATGTPRYETGAGAVAGWIDNSVYLNSYTLAGAGYGPNGNSYNTVTMPVFAGATGGGVQGWAFNGANLVGGTQPLGAVPHTYNFAANQELTAVNGAGAISRSGEFKINWTIKTGTNWTNTPTNVPYGPITLVNPNSSLNVVADSWVGGTYNTTNPAIPNWIAGPPSNVYYKAPNELTAYINGTQYTIPAGNTVPRIDINDGKQRSYFEGKPLLQVQVYVIPGELVKAAKAKGVDVNNLDALSKYISLNK